MPPLDFSTLRRTCANPQLEGQQMLSIMDTLFIPREITFTGIILPEVFLFHP